MPTIQTQLRPTASSANRSGRSTVRQAPSTPLGGSRREAGLHRTDERPTETATDELPLLHRLGRGDEAAVSEALATWGPLVWSIARRHHDERTEAEDAVQEIFIDLWRTASRFDPSMGSESTFVGTIAHRRCIDRHRRTQARPRFEDVAAAESGAGNDLAPRDRDAADPGYAEVEREDERSVLEEQLATLRPIQRRVIELCFFKGWSHTQIADALQMPLGTVKTHARRGLKRLREQLEGTGIAISLA